MSEQEQEVPLEPVQEEAPEVTEPAPQPEPVDSETQDEARKYGWRPKEDFDRNPDGWVDADRFLELPSTEVKRLRDESRVKETEFSDRIQRVEDMNQRAIKAALEAQQAEFDRTMETIRNGQRDAVESGDVDQFDKLEKQRLETKPPEPVSVPPQRDATIDQYRSSNAWTNDPVLWKMAIDAVGTNPDVMRKPTADQLAYAEERVRDLFPHKFETAKPKRTKVESGGIGAVSGSKGVRDLPPEAQRQGKEFVQEGLFKSLDEYAKAYHEA